MLNNSQFFHQKSIFLSVCVGFVTALLWLSPLLFGNYINHGVDVVSHRQWSQQFTAALKEGILWPQWLSQEGYGFGQPNFVTYPPGFYYITGLGQAITGDIWTGMKFSSLFFLTMCGTFIHLLLSTKVSRFYSALGTLAILGSPMIIASLYNYTGFPTFAAFGPMAAVLYFTLRDFPESRLSFGLVFSFSILTLTHILSAGLLALVIGSGLFINALVGHFEKPSLTLWRTFFYWAISALIGLSLVSFYLIDALIYSQGFFIQFEPISIFIDWRRSFSFPLFTQFFSKYIWATFQWYIPVIYLFGVSFIFYSLKIGKLIGSYARQQIFLLFCSSLVAFFLTTEVSYPLWQYIPYLQILQWPWRVLVTLALIVPVGVILAIAMIKDHCTAQLMGIGFLLISVLFSSAKIAQLVVENNVVHISDSYGPVRALSKYAESLDSVLAYRDQGGLNYECRNRNTICEEDQILSHQKSWVVTTPSPQSIRLPVFYYPAWELKINGNKVPIHHDPETGLVRVDLGAGVHHVALEWVGVPTKWIGNSVSIVTALLIFIGLWIFRRSNDPLTETI